MYAGGAEPLPSVIFFPLIFPGFLHQQIFFSLQILSLISPFVSVAGRNAFYFFIFFIFTQNKRPFSCSCSHCCCSLKQQRMFLRPCKGLKLRAGTLGVGRWKWSVYLSSNDAFSLQQSGLSPVKITVLLATVCSYPVVSANQLWEKVVMDFGLPTCNSRTFSRSFPEPLVKNEHPLSGP